MKGPYERRTFIMLTAGAMAAALMFGFVLFATITLRSSAQTNRTADAIVVLTGELARIETGIQLLRTGRGARLLITGVNRKLSREDLRRLTGLSRNTFDCCVDIGYAALDTTGNAVEARGWSEKHRFSSLIVVTSTYHMPRSMAEFAHAMPVTELIPHAVPIKSLAVPAWWLHVSATRTLASEYLKYLSSATRLGFVRLIRGFDDAVVVSPVTMSTPT
jgi:uncharacterized SAM-binding protein YcdF (DUF218 family)